MIVDSHCHLNNPKLIDQIDDVIKRAQQVGVGVLNTICTKTSETETLKQIASKYPNVYCTVGVHPHEVEKQEIITVEELVKLADHPKVIGIGETGLDYYYEHSKRELQIKSFINHIHAAKRLDLPVIVHTRDADQALLEILQNETFRGVLHCFTSTKELAYAALDKGLYISISGIVTFKNATHLQEIVKLVPLDRLLVETDAPYLAPNPMRGKTNEPAFLRHTVDFIAGILGVAPRELEDRTTKNFYDLFTSASA